MTYYSPIMGQHVRTGEEIVDMLERQRLGLP
jgi:hypothetical protein